MSLQFMGLGSRPIPYTSRQTAFLKRQYAADLTADEFNLWLEEGVSRGIQLMAGHFIPQVFNKNDPNKRRLSFIETIESMRGRAEASGNYRPAEDEPALIFDQTKKGPANPIGLVSATTAVFKYVHGEWHRSTGRAFWEEYAPVSDGKVSKSGKWASMPTHMLSLAAERIALNKAFPNLFINTYTPGEMERANILDISPSEYAIMGEQEERARKSGGALGNAMLVFNPQEGLVSVGWGDFFGEVAKFIDQADPEAVSQFRIRNMPILKEAWAREPDQALKLKKLMENKAGNLIVRTS